MATQPELGQSENSSPFFSGSPPWVPGPKHWGCVVCSLEGASAVSWIRNIAARTAGGGFTRHGTALAPTPEVTFPFNEKSQDSRIRAQKTGQVLRNTSQAFFPSRLWIPSYLKHRAPVKRLWRHCQTLPKILSKYNQELFISSTSQ